MKFKSKSLISIILSIMMVISMIIVAIPANAAVIDSEPVGAGSYYLWYALKKDNPAEINNKVKMISSGENIYEATITFNSSDWHRVLLNTSSTAANDSNAKVWTSSDIEYTVNSDISSKLSVAVREHSGFHMLEIIPKISSSLPVKFSYSSSNGLTISDGSTPTNPTTKPTTKPTTEPTTTIPVSSTTYYYSYYDGENNQYEPMNPMVNNNGVYTFEPSSSQLGNTEGIAKFKITTSKDNENIKPIPANNSEYCVNFHSPTITTSTAMQNANITAKILSDDIHKDVQISDKSKEYVITFTPDTINPLTGTISIDLKTSATDPTDPTEPTTAPITTPDAPTIKLYAADGTTETEAVEKGKNFIIKVTSPGVNNVVYRLFDSTGTKIDEKSNGVFEIATNDLNVGETYSYYVVAVYNENESEASNPVSVTINTEAGNKQVTIYFKSASASVYVPSLSIDGAAAAEMTRDKKTEGKDGTYFGSTYSGSLKFYWFYTKVTLDTTKEHTLKFTTKDNRVNASEKYTFTAAIDDKYYFAVDNLMGDTKLEKLTGKAEYIRNYHISATHMVHSTTYDNNVGFTWVKDSDGNYKEYAMGTYLKDNNISTASLTDLTSSSLLTIPSALTPNAMLEASSAPSFFTIKSATLAQSITAEIEEVSTLQYQLLDVNLDGKVDVKDSTMMQKALAGL